MQIAGLKKTLPLIALTASLFSCGGAASKNADIVVSFYPLEYLAKRIAGDKLSVYSIVPNGSEPHDFELKTSDVMTLSDAKLVFLNGLNMEPFQDSVIDRFKDKTYVLSDFIDNPIAVYPSSGGSYLDPHMWLDTEIYAKMGQTMLEQFNKISPDNASLFQSNYASLKKDLDDLRAYGESKNLGGKTIAVSHDAFRYMCREFGFSEIYINGFSPDDEPTASALQALLDAIEQKGIDTIFFEELGNQDIAAYIAEQTGAKVEVLSPLETVEEGEDYLSTYRQNIDRIAEAKSK